MCMSNPEASLGEADFNQHTRSSGIARKPWMSPYIAGIGANVRFSNFERMPETGSTIPTREKLMNRSPPRRQPMPDSDELREKWPQYVGAARIAWGEITEDELLNLKSHAEQLAGLIHARYAVTREEADMQVRRFFAKHHF